MLLVDEILISLARSFMGRSHGLPERGSRLDPGMDMNPGLQKMIKVTPGTPNN